MTQVVMSGLDVANDRVEFRGLELSAGGNLAAGALLEQERTSTNITNVSLRHTNQLTDLYRNCVNLELL